MKLDRVTITGADDFNSPEQLSEITGEFPFVEWGILVSGRHSGSPRFPSQGWMSRLASVYDGRGIKLSVHLCGSYIRDLLAGNFSFAESFPYFFKRCRRAQLNFHAEPQQVIGVKFIEALRKHSDLTDTIAGKRQFIFQRDNVNNDLLDHVHADAEDIDAVPLYDLSHGAGVLPAEWPKPEYIDVVPDDNGNDFQFPSYHGYAGGLGPDNLEEQLHKIAATGANRVWVDMETRVRTDDGKMLDLAKVRRCLEISKAFMEQQSPVVTA